MTDKPMTVEEITSLVFNTYHKKRIPVRATQMEKPFCIDTLEGVMFGKAGDYLICGIKGEFYPCDANVFTDSYDFPGEINGN